MRIRLRSVPNKFTLNPGSLAIFLTIVICHEQITPYEKLSGFYWAEKNLKSNYRKKIVPKLKSYTESFPFIARFTNEMGMAR